MEPPLPFLDDAVNAHLSGRLDAAANGYCRALAIDPAGGRALHLYGVLMAQGNDFAAAERLLARAARVQPYDPGVLAHLAGVRVRRNAPDVALDAIQAALVLDPAQADAAEYLGAACHALAGYRDAVTWSLRAHTLRPERAEPLVNLGTALRDSRQFGAADACFAGAIERDPQSRSARLGQAVSLLVQGRLEEGFVAFEARWKRLDTPQWRGEPFPGRRLLLHAEQGFGDAIQFVRFAAQAAERGGSVVLEAHPKLLRLFGNLVPGVELAARGDAPPPHDVQCPLMSLPHALGTTLDTIPPAPYLRAEAAEVTAWAERLGDGGPLRVGLAWAGNPEHANDRNRSMPMEALTPVLALPGVRFFSLHAGAVPLPPSVEDPMREVRDFAGAAALMANLDVIVTVDTATLHLAGALGRPTLALIAYAPDWRWLTDRADTPWYPTVELIRQPRPGAWGAVATLAAARLRTLATRKNSPGSVCR